MIATPLQELVGVVPEDRLITDPAGLKRYERDAVTPVGVTPRAAVIALSQDEVVETVRRCHASGTPFVARGTGSSLSGGSVPVAEGIVIVLKQLDRIIELDPVSRTAVVEPGVVNLDVSKAAEPYNLYYAPDPSSQAFCTIGGNVAFNSGGAHCLKYGMTSNHVLGIKAVLADGTVVELGGESLESVDSDMHGLFVGSEGLFGIALEITLRLLPRVEEYRTVLATYDSLEAAGRAVSSVVASGMLAGALEIMDPLAIKATEAATKAGYPLDVGALMIVELEGELEQVEADFEKLQTLIHASGAGEIRIAEDPQRRAALWKGRKAAFTAVRRVSRNYLVQDGVVPRGKLGPALAEIERLSKEYAIPVANVFHAGDGNLHPLILYEAEGCTATRHEAEKLASEIMHMCIDMGGSVTGEHGVGLEKLVHLPEMYGEADVALMRRLRHAMDPKLIANPGKMLTVDGEPPETPPPGTGGGPAGALRGAASLEMVKPVDPKEVVDVVRNASLVRVRGGGTKTGLQPEPQERGVVLDMRSLDGVLDYDPQEYTFTALAGTPLETIRKMLAENAQYLPFDPPFGPAGATIGGTVAAGLSGPRRFRYGGLRDFLIGLSFVDGSGELIRGGGRVVKNAAGFDFPKLMVGSLGRLGVLVELTFKVFPEPPSFTTVRSRCVGLREAQEKTARLSRMSLDLEALEIEPDEEGVHLWVRLSGRRELLEGRLRRIRDVLGRTEELDPEEELRFWRQRREMSWAEPFPVLIKVPTVLRRMEEMDGALREPAARRVYGMGGNVAFLAGEGGSPDRFDHTLERLGLRGLVLRGGSGKPFLGRTLENEFSRRVKRVLDPESRFRS